MGSDKDDKKAREMAEYQKLVEIDANQRNEAENIRINQLTQLYAREISKMKLAAQEQQYQVNPDMNPAQKNDFLELLKDYNRKYNAKVVLPEDPKKPCYLTFKNQEEAINFFREQAEKGQAFEMYDEEHDHCVYSDGSSKQLVHGTLAEVAAYKENSENYDVGEGGKLISKAPTPLSTTPTLDPYQR